MASYKVFLGTETGQWLAAEVLKYSILKRTSLPIEFYETRFFPQSQGIKRIKGASLDRFWIPEHCGYEGQALYLDPASLVFGDIKELFDLSMNNKGALALPMNSLQQAFFTDVMVLDCSKLKNWNASVWLEQINAKPELYHELFFVQPQTSIHQQFGPLPSEWYQMDKWSPSSKLLQFKNEMTWPWKFPGHSQRQLFIDELNHAIADGFIPKDVIHREVDWKQISPELLEITQQ